MTSSTWQWHTDWILTYINPVDVSGLRVLKQSRQWLVHQGGWHSILTKFRSTMLAAGPRTLPGWCPIAGLKAKERIWSRRSSRFPNWRLTSMENVDPDPTDSQGKPARIFVTTSGSIFVFLQPCQYFSCRRNLSCQGISVQNPVKELQVLPVVRECPLQRLYYWEILLGFELWHPADCLWRNRKCWLWCCKLVDN